MSGTTVVVGVVGNSHARPQDIAAATRACGNEPVFVAGAGTLDEANQADFRAYGELIECDPAAIGDTLTRLRRLRPAAITTFSEGTLRMTSRLAAGLDLPFHDRATTAALTDKHLQRRRLAESGVDPVRSVRVTSRDAAIAALRGAAPAVVKPATGQSSRDTYLVETPEQLPAGVVPSPQQPFLVEEYLRGRPEKEFGDYVSVEAVVSDGTAHLIGVTGKFPLLPPFREHGQFVPTHLPDAEAAAVAELAGRAAKALGVRSGLLHTEVKLTAEGPRIIEVNGRVGGFLGELYHRAAGVDLFELGIRVACGASVTVTPIRPQRVTFHYFNLPPIAGGVLREVIGVHEVRRQPGIDDYQVRFRDGQQIEASVMTQLLDLLRGSAPDHAAMLELLDTCLAQLSFRIEQPAGTVRCWRPVRGEMCLL